MSSSRSLLRYRSAILWLLCFYLPMAALAVGSLVKLRDYARQSDAALVTGQRTTALAASMSVFGEQLAKAVLLVEKNIRDQQPYGDSIYQLQIAADRLDQIINAFNEGSETVAPDGVRFMVEAVSDPDALVILNQINVIWLGIKTQADGLVLSSGPKKAVTDAKPFTDATLSKASVFVAAQQNRLIEQNQALGRRLETLGKDKITALETPRNLLIALAVLAWLALPGALFINRIRRARNAATQLASDLGESQKLLQSQALALTGAKTETDRIMETVQEGLFLIDAQGVIGEHHSAELKRILRQEDIAGRNLLHLLERLLPEKMFQTTKDYLGLLFDPSRKEKAVLKVNPLTDIEINFTNPAGGFINRYLGFTFRRIVVDGGRVARVFVAVRDVTPQVELEKKLRDSEKHKDRQLGMLLSIVHIAPAELESFTQLVDTELNTINNTLRAEDVANAAGQGDALRARLQTVFRSVHNLKGNAAVLQLAAFQKAADDFETKVADLLQAPVLTGDDFLSIVIAQAGLRSDLADLQELRGKLTGLRPAAPGTLDAPLSAAHPIASGLHQLVADAARELDQVITLHIDDYALHTVAAGRPGLVRDVLIQLTRNALAHSIEPAPHRQQHGKTPSATISIRGLPRTGDGLVGLAFRDDGRGLDLDAIHTRATASGLLASTATPTPAELAHCIFAPGFSTAAAITPLSGRGMGMDIIKNKIVDEAGGALEVHCTPKEFCEFHLYLPS